MGFRACMAVIVLALAGSVLLGAGLSSPGLARGPLGFRSFGMLERLLLAVGGAYLLGLAASYPLWTPLLARWWRGARAPDDANRGGSHGNDEP